MPENEKNQVITSLRVDPELWKKAKMEAIRYDLTLAELVDESIRDWLKKKREEDTHG